MKRKILVTILSGMLAICMSVSAVMMVSAVSGTSLVVGDDPMFTSTVDLTSEDAAAQFKGVFVGGSDRTVTAGDATQVWDFDAANGTVTSKASLVQDVNSVWSDWFYLYYTGAEYKNFYMEVTLQHVGLDAGWSGLAYGVEDSSKPAKGAAENPKGGLSFVQGDGKYTWHNLAINPSEWNDTGVIATNFNGLTDTVHHLKVYEGHMQYWLNDEDPIVIDVTMDAAALTSGNVGVAVTNKTVAVKSFKVTSLKSDGTVGSDDYIAPEQIQVTGIENGQTAELGKALDVSVSVLPQGASAEYTFTSSNPAAVYSGGKLYFKETGNYMLTFASRENAEVKTVIVVTVEGPQGYIAYPFTENTMAQFDPVFIAGGSGTGGIKVGWEEYFEIADGVLTTKGEGSGNVGNNYKALYFANRKTDNFEIVFSAKASGNNGWFGVQFAMADTTKAGNQDGVFAMMQHAAKRATFWGGPVTGVGGPHEIDSSYAPDAWNLFKIRVLNGVMEFYVNDMATPVLTKSAQSVSGEIALFVDDGCKVSFKDVYFGYLTDDGEVDAFVSVEAVTIENKIETAKVGDKITLDVTVAPETASDPTLLFASDNPIVASVNDKGEITCLMAGTTTITVTSKDNAKSDSFVLTVEENDEVVAVSSIEITNKVTEAKAGDELTLQVTVNPADASNKGLKYETSDSSVATVSNAGKVVFVKAGEVTITVKSEADGTVSDSFTVTVSEAGEAAEDGCSSSVAGIASIAVSFSLGVGAILAMKKRKETK